MRVLLAGGGTAGHTSPLLATADALRRLDPDRRGHLPRHAPRPGEPRGARGRLPARADPAGAAAAPPQRRPAAGARAGCAARCARRSPSSTGSAPTWSSATAATSRCRPTSPPAAASCRWSSTSRTRCPAWPTRSAPGSPAGSPSASPTPRCANAEYVGLPIRRMISHLDRAAIRAEARAFFGLDPDRPTLLVTGGSQGARRLNQAGVRAPPRALADAGRPGAARASARTARPRPSPPACPTWSSTSWTGWTWPTPPPTWWSAAPAPPASPRPRRSACPAVFVPLPIGNGEQDHNARPVVDAGGGLLVADGALTSEWVAAHRAGPRHGRRAARPDGRGGRRR